MVACARCGQERPCGERTRHPYPGGAKIAGAQSRSMCSQISELFQTSGRMFFANVQSEIRKLPKSGRRALCKPPPGAKKSRRRTSISVRIGFFGNPILAACAAPEYTNAEARGGRLTAETGWLCQRGCKQWIRGASGTLQAVEVLPIGVPNK